MDKDVAATKTSAEEQNYVRERKPELIRVLST
jgi:hypothetical protein